MASIRIDFKLLPFFFLPSVNVSELVLLLGNGLVLTGSLHIIPSLRIGCFSCGPSLSFSQFLMACLAMDLLYHSLNFQWLVWEFQ